MNRPGSGAVPAVGGSGAWMVAFGAVTISFSAVFVKLSTVGPAAAGVHRLWLGGLALWIAARLTGDRLWQGWKPFWLALAAAFFFTLDLSCWHRSIHWVGPGLATILTNFQVFFMAAFGSIFLGERLGARIPAAIILAMAGLYLLVGLARPHQGDLHALGVVLGLCAAAAYAAYLVTLRHLQMRPGAGGVLANVAMVSFWSGLFMALEGIWSGETFLPQTLLGWAPLVGYGLLCQALGWYLITRGLSLTAASRTGLILLLHPPWPFFGTYCSSAVPWMSWKCAARPWPCPPSTWVA